MSPRPLSVPDDEGEPVSPLVAGVHVELLLLSPRGLPDPDTPAWAPLASQVLGDLVEGIPGLTVAVFERASERRRAELVLRGTVERVQVIEAASDRVLPEGVVLADHALVAQRPELLGAARCLVVSRLALPWPRPPWVPAPTGEDPCRFLRHDLPQGVRAFRRVVDPFLAGPQPEPRLLAVLDPRLLNRPYGRWFLNALPRMRRSRELDEALTHLCASRSGVRP